MILLTEVVLILISVALVVHANRTEGKAFVLLFWLGGALLGLLREFIVGHYMEFYRYGEFTLMMFGVPLIMMLFWTNFSYIALRWSDNLLRSEFLSDHGSEYHAPLIFLVMAAIAMFVEAYASQFSMIIWIAHPVLKLWGETPVIVPFGYGAMGLLYLIAFRFVWLNDEWLFQKKLFILTGMIPLIILIQLGFLFMLKLGISLAFS